MQAFIKQFVPNSIKIVYKISTTQMVTEQITVTYEGVRKLLQKACADPESFVRGGPTLTPFFFSLMRGGRIQIPLLVGHQ